MRAGVGLKRTFQLLQLEVGLLGDLRHGRRGVVRDLDIVVALRGLELRQIGARVLGEHREHKAPAVARVIDDERLLERHHAGIGLTALNLHAATYIVL